MSDKPVDFPKYAPLTVAGEEYDGNPDKNPFKGSSIENYFSKQFVLELKQRRKDVGISSRIAYMLDLERVAIGFIKGDPDVLNAVSPLVTNINPVHPFLEPSGAIRVQVPLPQNMEQLYILCEQILGNKTVNKMPNLDKYKLTPKGLSDPKFPFPWVYNGKEEIYLKKGQKPYERGLMIWDDPSGYAGINPEIRFPNLTLLLLSIMFQQTDVDAYGARGRYGDATLKRLLDGHGIQCSEEKPSHRMLSMISFDCESGMPKGYISAAVYKTTVPLQGGKSVTVDTIFNHYAFVPNCSPTFQSNLKMTQAMYIYMLGYTSCYITGKPLLDHYLVAHSDKSPAIKAVCDAGKYISANKEIYAKIADDAFDAITPVASRGSTFKEKASVAEFPHIQFYDQSTVPRDDPGEEVPVPSDRFYIPVYRDYINLIKSKKPEAVIPAILSNGGLQEKHLPALREIAVRYGYKDEAPLLKWMRTPGSYKPLGARVLLPLLDDTDSVPDNFPINDRKQIFRVDPTGLDPQPNSESGKLEDFRADILYFLIKVAKDGNTGNIDYPGALPRLTDFAFMVTYQIPIGYRSAIDWGVTYTISHLITSFSLFQQNKIKYLGKNASDLHNSLITVGASAMQTAVFNVMIGTLGVAQGVAEYIRSKPKKKSEATSKL
tara:strand:- start:16311 stop:18287 length:1977 start_codon:yes stop_codon:yes gene_type:complete